MRAQQKTGTGPSMGERRNGRPKREVRSAQKKARSARTTEVESRAWCKASAENRQALTEWPSEQEGGACQKKGGQAAKGATAPSQAGQTSRLQGRSRSQMGSHSKSSDCNPPPHRKGQKVATVNNALGR